MTKIINSVFVNLSRLERLSELYKKNQEIAGSRKDMKEVNELYVSTFQIIDSSFGSSSADESIGTSIFSERNISNCYLRNIEQITGTFSSRVDCHIQVQE